MEYLANDFIVLAVLVSMISAKCICYQILAFLFPDSELAKAVAKALIVTAVMVSVFAAFVTLLVCVKLMFSAF